MTPYGRYSFDGIAPLIGYTPSFAYDGFIKNVMAIDVPMAFQCISMIDTLNSLATGIDLIVSCFVLFIHRFACELFKFKVGYVGLKIRFWIRQHDYWIFKLSIWCDQFAWLLFMWRCQIDVFISVAVVIRFGSTSVPIELRKCRDARCSSIISRGREAK